MPLLENLVQGLSHAAGSTASDDILKRRKDDRSLTQHAELQSKSDAILNDVKNLQERRSKLPPDSPEIADIDQALHDHQQAFTDLYHPTKNPGALQHLGRYLEKHIARRDPKPLPASNAVTPERMAGLQASAAGTQSPDPYLTPDELKKKYRIAAGLDPRAGVEKPESENWVPTTVKLADGREVTLQRNSKDGRWTDLAGKEVPADVLSSASLAPKTTGKPTRAWRKDKTGKITSVLLDPQTNQPIPGSENADILPPAGMTGRISTGFYHFVDEHGNVHQIQETHTSMPAGQGTAGTPGEARHKAASVAPKDTVLGQKETPVQAKAHNTYIAAYQLSEAADKAAKEPENAQSQKSLAVALERAVAGRFTTQALDYILKAGWSAGAEQFWNNIDNGTLPTVVMKNLVQRAHDNKDTAYSAWQESRKGAAAGNDDDEFLKKIK